MIPEKLSNPTRRSYFNRKWGAHCSGHVGAEGRRNRKVVMTLTFLMILTYRSSDAPPARFATSQARNTYCAFQIITLPIQITQQVEFKNASSKYVETTHCLCFAAYGPMDPVSLSTISPHVTKREKCRIRATRFRWTIMRRGARLTTERLRRQRHPVVSTITVTETRKNFPIFISLKIARLGGAEVNVF
ncbi:hypothetical protein CEXT_658411 [Caerostris extrusa]|uniref:Uncharacterized protein n=1 Tax=Caerostris extrusa TaxID=172846 RepID=A0AAV4R2A2_CAEEX|nr:hypothetical protein CEXT_658411 [Caerostris extrusa]